MNNIPFPDISKNMTVEDIHKIREWNYERRKGMNAEEVKRDIRRGADEFRRLMRSDIPAQRQA